MWVWHINGVVSVKGEMITCMNDGVTTQYEKWVWYARLWCYQKKIHQKGGICVFLPGIGCDLSVFVMICAL